MVWVSYRPHTNRRYQQMLTKAELRDLLTEELESRNVDFADEIADSFVERLDEDGKFDPDEDTDG